MRADRLLSILLLLQVHQRLTARDLAERLEVSERTILRDMEALGAAGVPVMAERGTGGGWHLMQAYQTQLTGLNTAEIQTLFFDQSPRLLADLGLGRAADAARIKLLASLPAISQQSVEYTRERLHIDGAGWFESREQLPFLSLLQEAVWQDRQVQMTYRRADGTTRERLANPLGLVAKGAVWYLAAEVDGELRSYRVSRVQAARITEMPCVRPKDFDLAAFWTQSVADIKIGLPCYPAVVRASPDFLTRMRQTKSPRIEQEELPESDGWTRLSVLFEVEGEACDFIIRAGPQIEAVEPAALRTRVREAAQKIAALHRV